MKTICNYVSKIIGGTLFFVCLIHVQSSESSECIQNSPNRVVRWSISKIESSDIATVIPLTCDEEKIMHKMKIDKISITSGRKRGKATICLSDEKDYPCKFIIGNIYPGIDSSEAIKQIYSFSPPQSSQLNETDERLFLNPSSLIQ